MYRWEVQSWMVSQFLHGEQGALVVAARQVEEARDVDSKLCAAMQVADEARYVEVFSRYLRDKIPDDYPMNAALRELIEDILGDDRTAAVAPCEAGGMRSTECAVWWAHPRLPDRHPGLVDLLDGHERARLTALRPPGDSSRYLAAHALARLVLGGRLGTAPQEIGFDRDCRCGQPHGKPRLSAPSTTEASLHFSIAHSGDVVGIALADGPVGLDVEKIRPLSDLAAMTAHVYSSTERNRLNAADEVAFFTTWTRKEALLKATGTGLSRPMAAITLASNVPAVEDWSGSSAARDPVWLADLRPASDHPAAVAGFGENAPSVAETDGDELLGHP